MGLSLASCIDSEKRRQGYIQYVMEYPINMGTNKGETKEEREERIANAFRIIKHRRLESISIRIGTLMWNEEVARGRIKKRHIDRIAMMSYNAFNW